MTTSKKKSPAIKFLEQSTKGPLTFGKMMESIRLCEESSQADFARKLGVSRSHLCDIEKNRKMLSPMRAAKFAKILGFSQDQFVRLTLQNLLDKSGLKYQVELHKEAA